MVRQSPIAPPMTAQRRQAPPEQTDAAVTIPEPDWPADSALPRAATELGPIIRAKIQPPVLRQSTLTRQRLIDRLTTAARSRLTLVTAEAGYGKTTLLADFAARSGIRTLWFRLDPTDADIVTWTNHIIAAAREHQPEFGQATLDLMSQLAAGGPPKTAFMASVIGELGDLEPVATVLVLDDFHVVDDSDEACEFVSRLTRDAPPWLTLIVSSRITPTFEMGKLTASGELVEIHTDELRFTHDEIVELFAVSYGTPLDEDVLRDLNDRVKGWIASLQLFHGSIRGRPPGAVREFARALSGATNPIYDFLAEEVLSNLPPRLEELLIRSSILERITTGLVVALFADRPDPPGFEEAREWIEEADRLAMLSQSSQSTDARQLHPLLREYLARELRQRASKDVIRGMHLRVAEAVVDTDALTAAHHYLEAGDERNAMHCLGASVMLTMGSGQWGVASDLIERIQGVPADPAVAAIRARQLIEAGDLEGGADLLNDVDVSNAPPEVRGVFRHTTLSLGWRTGDRDLMFATLREIEADDETPSVLREIFQIFVDASPLSPTPVPYATLAARMERMAETQREAGHTYYSAISLHNAAIAMVAAGRFRDAIRLGELALGVFERLPHVDTDKYSTHAILALARFELGEGARAGEHLKVALGSGLERGDVHAECAYTLATLGERAQATQLLTSADELERQGRSDLPARLLTAFCRALLRLPEAPSSVKASLTSLPSAMPLDTGYELERQLLVAAADLLSGESAQAMAMTRRALEVAREKNGRRVIARLELISAMAAGSADELRSAVALAAATGAMAMPLMADALGRHLWLVPEVPSELRASMAQWPARWLPVLRRQLGDGATPNAAIAARLLDELGDQTDVGRVRAFAKTYRKTVKGAAHLGKTLARRVAPVLHILDLGRTRLVIGDRNVDLAQMRRKSAALLMYLVTRPGHSATKEQVLDELWPDSDPDAAVNNLNQALYFLRRDIDPWFEDDISVDYVGYQGDLVWLDLNLCSISSVEFASRARAAMVEGMSVDGRLEVLVGYSGRFSPEFEYEEWAIAWRNRAHAIFLELANSSLDLAIRDADLPSARDAALLALERDPQAEEIERKLIWVYWELGSRSAALTQHEHLVAVERSDGLEPTPFEQIVGGANAR